MGYLHVTIKKKESSEWICIFKDLSLGELKRKFVKPYKLGISIYFDGNILPSSEISKVAITETKKPHAEELRVMQEESFKRVQEFNRSMSSVTLVSIGCGYNDYEINECGNNVTNEYISGGPGSGTPAIILANFIKHPWVVRIFGGLVFLSAAAYLGFK